MSRLRTVPAEPACSFLVATPAKVNLGLRVLRRRSDGYHDIYSVMEPISLADTLYGEFHPDGEGLRFHCPQLPELDPAENLAVRAARAVLALARERGCHRPGGWDFFLDKRIPVGAGLGGGSSNAAAVIRELMRFYGLKPDPEERCRLALSLGADVPFFLEPRLALVEGVGERLTPLGPPRRRWYLLLRPPYTVATGWAYSALRLDRDRPPPDWDLPGLTRLAPAGRLPAENDFEDPVGERYPQLYEIKRALALQPGCRQVLMSGSGSVIYGMFVGFAAMKSAAAVLGQSWRKRGAELFCACNLDLEEGFSGAKNKSTRST